MKTTTIYEIGAASVEVTPVIENGRAGVAVDVWGSHRKRLAWYTTVWLKPRSPRWLFRDMTVAEAVQFAVGKAQREHRRNQDAAYMVAQAQEACTQIGAEARALMELERELGAV